MSTSNWYWSWVKNYKETAKASSSVPQSGGMIYTYRAPERGQLSAAQLKTSIDSFSTNINQQWSLWNAHIRPILDSLPAGPRDQRWYLKDKGLEKIDALMYGLQASTLMVFNDADETRAYGRYWDISTQRPKTIAEALEDIWIAISEIETAPSSSGSTSDLQPLWTAIGTWYQTGVASASGSLDWRLLQVEANENSILSDIYGTGAGFGSFGSATYSMAEFVHYLAILHGVPSGWNGGNPAFVAHSSYTDLVQALATFVGKTDYQNILEVPNYSSVINIVQGSDLVTAISALDAAITTSGGIIGPAGAVDENIVIFDGVTGSLAKDSGVALSDLAPSDSPYWLSVADAGLSNGVSIGALGDTTGSLLKVVTTLGTAVPELAVGDTDFQLPLTFPASVVRNVYDQVELDGDSGSPGNNYFYGANRSGTKGFHTRGVANHISVGQAGSDVDFNSIGAAVAYALSQGAGGYPSIGSNPTDQWEITVYPGVYIEDPITVVMGVNIRAFELRVDTVFVVANDATQDFFTMVGGFICGLNISGAVGGMDPGTSLIKVETAGTLNVLHSVSLSNAVTGIHVTSGATCIATNMASILSAVTQKVTTLVKAEDAGTYVGISGMLVSAPSTLATAMSDDPIRTIISCNDSAEVYLSAATIRSAWFDHGGGSCLARVVECYDSSIVLVAGAEFANCGNVLCVGALGEIVTQGASFKNNNLNFDMYNTTGKIYVNQSVDTDSYTTTSGATIAGIVQVRDEELTRILGAAKYRYLSVVEDDLEEDVDLGRFFFELGSVGISSGGVVTALTGLDIRVTSVYGWAKRLGTSDIYSFVSTDVGTGYTDFTLTASETNYVYYNASTQTINTGTSEPGYEENVLLATVITDGSGIRFLHQTRNIVDAPVERLRERLIRTHDKTALVSGLLLREGSVASTKIAIDDGQYFLGLDKITVSVPVDGSADTEFSYFYGIDGATEVASQTSINSTQYYDVYSDALVSLGAGMYKSDSVLVTSDSRCCVLYGSAEYATEEEAIAASFETIPTFIKHSSCTIARLVIKQGEGIVAIVDERPQGGGGGVVQGGSSGAVAHDDTGGAASSTIHTSFLMLNGSRAMSGNLDMGGNSITNINLVDGIDVTAHASRHVPGAADGLAMAATSDVQAITAGSVSAAYVGTSNKYAYATHNHAITTSASTPQTVGTTGSAGSGTALALANHAHAHALIATSATLYHALATATNPGFMSSAHYSKVQDDVVTNTTDTSTVGRFASFTDTAGKVIADSGYSYSSFATAAHNHSGVYEPVLTKGNLTEVTSSVLTITGGTGAVIGSGTTILVKAAATAQSGYLTSTDWNTFNGKIGGSTGANYSLVLSTGVAGQVTSSNATYTSGTLALGTAAAPGVVRLNGSTSGYVSIATVAAPTSYTLVLPSTVGTANYVLRNSSTPGQLEWYNLPAPGSGDVVGPASAIDSNFVAFNTTTGKLIKDSTYNANSFLQVTGTQTNTGVKSFNDGTLKLNGATSGATTLVATAIAGTTTQTFQAVTGTVYCSGGTDIPIADGGTGSSSIAAGVVTSNGTALSSSAVLGLSLGGTNASSLAAGAIYSTGTALASETALSVSRGGSGRSSVTTYMPICGGTTTAGANQSVTATGTLNNALKYVSSGALPVWGQVATSELNVDASLGSSSYEVLVRESSAIRYRTFQTLHDTYHVATGSVSYSNIFVGNQALTGSKGDYNVAVGQYTLTSLTTNIGTNNTAVGAYALRYLDCPVAGDGIGNTAIGAGAGANIKWGTYNIALGYHPMYAASGTNNGDYNIAIGYDSFTGAGSSTGNNNIALGTDSCYSSVSNYGIAIGYQAGYRYQSDYNIGIGYRAAAGVYTGAVDNIGIGRSALGKTSAPYSTGDYNIAIGSLTLDSLTTGGSNVAIGVSAGTAITTGAGNVCIGQNSVIYSIGNTNIAIGSGAQCNHEAEYPDDNNIAIGYSAIATGGSIAIGTGTTAGGAGPVIRIGTGAAGYAYWYAGGIVWTNTSDLRLKTNIKPSEGLSVILALNPIHYDHLEGEKDKDGFIAQEYMEVLPSQVSLNPSSKRQKEITGSDSVYALTQDLNPFLVKAIQEQQAMINELRNEIKALKGE